jgi:hypothetical protein
MTRFDQNSAPTAGLDLLSHAAVVQKAAEKADAEQKQWFQDYQRENPDTDPVTFFKKYEDKLRNSSALANSTLDPRSGFREAGKPKPKWPGKKFFQSLYPKGRAPKYSAFVAKYPNDYIVPDGYAKRGSYMNRATKKIFEPITPEPEERGVEVGEPPAKKQTVDESGLAGNGRRKSRKVEVEDDGEPEEFEKESEARRFKGARVPHYL